MSLGLRILTAIVLLGAALAVQLSLNATGSWSAAKRAETMLQLNAVSTHLLDAAGALAAERGLANGALANAAAADASTRSAIATQRAKAIAARAQALDARAAVPPLPGSGIAAVIAA